MPDTSAVQVCLFVFGGGGGVVGLFGDFVAFVGFG